MKTGKEIASRLKDQLGHYVAMRLAVERQTGFIRAKDVGGLVSGATEVRGLMRKIRDLEASLRPLRQTWMSRAVDRPVNEQQEIEDLISSIRENIEAIQGLKDENESLLKEAMAETKKEMAGLRSQSQAARAYQGRQPDRHARFVDKSN